MVADMLILMALTTAPTVGTEARAHVEVRATAVIQRAVTLQNGVATTRKTEMIPIPQKPRDCAPDDKPAPDCRLIVYDLP